ncbi:DUF461 domain-containing protein [Kitasatospora sp. NPDC094028]
MSRSLRRGSIAAIAAIAIASLSSCAAGNTPDTLQIKPDNAAATIGTSLRLNNIVIVTPVKSAGDYTGPANVVVNIANSGSNTVQLKSVTVGTGGSATFADAAGAPLAAIPVPAGGAVAIGGQGNVAATVPSASVTIGGFAKTTFTMQEVDKDNNPVGAPQTVTADAGVSSDSDVKNKDIYNGYGPTVAPSTTAPAKPASPSASAPATPGAGATTPAAPGTTATPGAGATTGAATPVGTTPTAH